MLRRNLGSLLDYARSTEGFAPYALDDPRPFDAPRLARQQIESAGVREGRRAESRGGEEAGKPFGLVMTGLPGR